MFGILVLILNGAEDLHGEDAIAVKRGARSDENKDA